MKKLSLNRETVRKLDSSALQKVEGGANIWIRDENSPTYWMNFTCWGFGCPTTAQPVGCE